MKVNLEYEIGTHIWVVNEKKDVLQVYDDYILSIDITEEGINYITKEAFAELKEEEIILYEDEVKLNEKIKGLMKKIRNIEFLKANELHIPHID